MAHLTNFSFEIFNDTAIPAFGFEGHISAAVSRGPAPGRSRGWRGPAFDRSYCACPELTMTFFSLLPSIQRSDEDWRLPAFFSSSITSTDKNCSQTKKKRPCKRSSCLSGGLLVSDFFQSEKQRSLDDQRHRSEVDGLR